VRSNIPPRAKNQKVRKRRGWVPRGRGQNAENRRVDVVDRDRTDIDKLGQVVLVWDVVSVPCDYIEGRVLLRAAEELAAELVHDLPSLLLDLILRNGVLKVASIGESVCAQGSKFWKLEAGAPDF
jgi:hypothetical protein